MAGSRGPMPKPLALRVVSSTGRDRTAHEKVNEREPKPRLGVLAPPKQLERRARVEYERLVDEMKRAHPQLLTQLDCMELAICCESWVQWLDLVEKINRDKAKPKGSVDRFDVVMLTKFAQQMHMSGDRLGLSPAARTRLSMPEGSPIDDDDF